MKEKKRIPPHTQLWKRAGWKRAWIVIREKVKEEKKKKKKKWKALKREEILTANQEDKVMKTKIITLNTCAVIRDVLIIAKFNIRWQDADSVLKTSCQFSRNGCCCLQIPGEHCGQAPAVKDKREEAIFFKTFLFTLRVRRMWVDFIFNIKMSRDEAKIEGWEGDSQNESTEGKIKSALEWGDKD